MSHPSLLMIGDELESLLAAGLLAQVGWRVTLLRSSTHWLGGLSTRGGLSYMDLTPELMPPLLGWFLSQVGLQRVALEPARTSAFLWNWLTGADVRIISGLRPQPEWSRHYGITALQDPITRRRWQADVYWDGTPDATLCRAVGVPYLKGMAGVFGADPSVQTLGVSPVFRLTGISAQELAKAEAALRTDPHSPALLARTFPWLSEEQRQTLIERPTYCPPDSDYLDILNPLIGAWFHQFCHGETVSYEEAPYWIDGGNVSRLSDGSLGFNGLVARLPDLPQQIALSEERTGYPARFYEAMTQVERFLQTVCGLPQARVIAPPALYIRQTVLTQARQNVTGLEILQGGVPLEQAVASFSYWLDYRGVPPWRAYPSLHPLPKPIFNLSLAPCLPAPGQPGNLVRVSRSAGFSPISQGACRIVQHNATLAEALALALIRTKGQVDPLAQLDPQGIRTDWAALAERLKQPFAPIAGTNVLPPDGRLAQADWLQRDIVAVSPTGPWTVEAAVAV